MKKKLQFLWENVSDQRQFEESCRKKCDFCGKFFAPKQFEETHTKNTCDEERIATFVGKSSP